MGAGFFGKEEYRHLENDQSASKHARVFYRCRYRGAFWILDIDHGDWSLHGWKAGDD